MSDIAAHAIINVMLADFAIADPQGKVNILGAGVTGIGFDPAQATTTRFTLVAQISLPRDRCPAEFAVEIALLDASGDIADLPGPAGPQKMRVGQVVNIEKAVPLPGSGVPREALRGQANIILDFGNGLPLTPGGAYRWRLQIDGDETVEVTYPFGVAGPPAGPVIG